MALRQKQIRYIKDGDARNFPAGLTRNQLVGGTIWDSKTRIVSLTISALIGFGFYVNDTPTMIRILHPGNPIEQGSSSYTFTFPARVLNMSPIYNIKMDAASVDRLIAWNTGHPTEERWLFIDYVNDDL